MFDFKLTPAYCLFNGAAIIEQNGSEILFMVENLEDVVLQGRLRRAFQNYLESIVGREDCPEKYKKTIHIDFIKGSRDQLRKCVSGLYRVDGDYPAEEKEDSAVQAQRNAAAVLLLDTMLQEAREMKATDIHIEGNSIRFRVGGKLKKQMDVQNDRSVELIQRIKLLAGMNVIEKRRSQDGRFTYGAVNPMFVRVSSVGIVGKNHSDEESIVLRLLDTSRIPLSLNLLGFNEEQLNRMETIRNARNGLVLVCGSTGAGKSTTVASMLVELEKAADGNMKIISLEDPPEYVIPGVTQVQVDEVRGNGFKQVLEHVFRQDPDVIMIGEIRDELSGAAALRAALTGHLVFATLHTGGAGEAILRMENLGMDRKMLGSVLRGIICQELDYRDGVPELCADVAIPDERFATAVSRKLSEEQIDGLFYHVTNYSEVLSRTLSDLKASKNMKVDRSKVKGKNKKLPVNVWNGGADDSTFHSKAN